MSKTPKHHPHEWLLSAMWMRDSFTLDLTASETEIIQAVAARGSLGAVIDCLDLILTRRHFTPASKFPPKTHIRPKGKKTP